MYKVFAALYFLALSAVYAELYSYSDALYLGKGYEALKENKLVYYKSYTYYYGYAYDKKNVKSVYLVPKLGADFSSGFLVPSPGSSPLLLPDVKLDVDEYLLYLVAFTDCYSWYGVLLAVYTPYNATVYKPYAYDKLPDGSYKSNYLDGLYGLGDYLYAKLTKEVYTGLKNEGLASNALTAYVDTKYFY